MPRRSARRRLPRAAALFATDIILSAFGRNFNLLPRLSPLLARSLILPPFTLPLSSKSPLKPSLQRIFFEYNYLFYAPFFPVSRRAKKWGKNRLEMRRNRQKIKLFVHFFQLRFSRWKMPFQKWNYARKRFVRTFSAKKPAARARRAKFPFVSSSVEQKQPILPWVERIFFEFYSRCSHWWKFFRICQCFQRNFGCLSYGNITLKFLKWQSYFSALNSRVIKRKEFYPAWRKIYKHTARVATFREKAASCSTNNSVGRKDRMSSSIWIRERTSI